MIMVFQLPININMGTSTSFNRFDKDTASGVYSICLCIVFTSAGYDDICKKISTTAAIDVACAFFANYIPT